jgi:hypothetical protein
MGDCTELATIRAHIEGLEAEVRREREAASGWKFQLDGLELMRLRDNAHLLERAEAAEARVRELEGWRDAVLDGNAVYAALTQDQRRRTSADNVSDVLDAAAKVARIVPEGEQR